MNKILYFFIIMTLFMVSEGLSAFNRPPEPVLMPQHFLLIDDIPEFNLDFALAWSDSAAGLFLQPFDAVVLHVDVGGTMRDVFVFSDVGMNRLTAWMCSEPNASHERTLLKITSYDGDDIGGFIAPSGITTNAKDREFDPESDLIYLADRGNDRIVSLNYFPDSTGGYFQYYDSFGAETLELPIDVTISAYLGQDASTADLYVVSQGHQRNGGFLTRFALDGSYECTLRDILPDPAMDSAMWRLYKPISVACYPDTVQSGSYVYITEAINNVMFGFMSTTDSLPYLRTADNLQGRLDFYEPGAVDFDGQGRVYIVNRAQNTIELYEPYMYFPYETYGHQRDNSAALVNPTNIIFDNYHGFCEALVFEKYFRQSGFKSYIIQDGSTGQKVQRGFAGNNHVKPAAKPAAAIPVEYKLFESYPNPFNSNCIIKFDVPKETRVKIAIYNVLGQRIRTLLDEVKLPGEYSLVFKSGDLVSGTYFYTIDADNFSETKSMVLIK
jgi:hypothetical protein